MEMQTRKLYLVCCSSYPMNDHMIFTVNANVFVFEFDFERKRARRLSGSNYRSWRCNVMLMYNNISADGNTNSDVIL